MTMVVQLNVEVDRYHIHTKRNLAATVASQWYPVPLYHCGTLPLWPHSGTQCHCTTVPLWYSATVASLLLSAHYKFQPMANRTALQLLQIECNKQQPIVWLTTYIYSDLDKHIDLEFIFLII